MHAALAAPHTDDEQRRKCFKTFLKYWINKSIDDSKLVTDEINILGSAESCADPHHTPHHDDSHRSRPTAAAAFNTSAAEAKKPFIITRDAIQAQVFGVGYPSVPVYSIGEFYDQLADKGMMPKALSTSGDKHGDGGEYIY